MAKQLRVRGALPGDLSSTTSIHVEWFTASCNSSSVESGASGLARHLCLH